DAHGGQPEDRPPQFFEGLERSKGTKKTSSDSVPGSARVSIALVRGRGRLSFWIRSRPRARPKLFDHFHIECSNPHRQDTRESKGTEMPPLIHNRQNTGGAAPPCSSCRLGGTFLHLHTPAQRGSGGKGRRGAEHISPGRSHRSLASSETLGATADPSRCDPCIKHRRSPLFTYDFHQLDADPGAGPRPCRVSVWAAALLPTGLQPHPHR